MDIAQIVGERLRAARGDRSQRELADAAGISQRVVESYEQGRRKPPVDVLVRLAKALGVRASYLLGEDDRGATPSVEAVMRTSEGRAALSSLVRLFVRD